MDIDGKARQATPALGRQARAFEDAYALIAVYYGYGIADGGSCATFAGSLNLVLCVRR
jgi:hypothetical protein